MKLKKIISWLDETLNVKSFSDVSNNGLQIARTGDEIECVAFGVDGSAKFIEEAAKAGAQLAIVHHGISWGGGIKTVTGGMYNVIAKAIRNERVYEHREEKLGYHKFLRMAAVTSIYTLLTGIAFGFLGTNLGIMLVMVLLLTVVVVAAGVYTGYHFGFVHKTKAYICGAVLLWIAGVDVIVRHIMV